MAREYRKASARASSPEAANESSVLDRRVSTELPVGVAEVACWAHARRKFYDARNSDAATSTQALAYIRLLYDVEDEAKQQAEALEHASQAADTGGLPRATRRAELIRALRQEKSVPRLGQFRVWLESQQASRGGPVLPKSPMGQAITYALNQWDALCVYTADGDLAIDNNVSENALRRVAIGRNYAEPTIMRSGGARTREFQAG